MMNPETEADLPKASGISRFIPPKMNLPKIRTLDAEELEKIESPTIQPSFKPNVPSNTQSLAYLDAITDKRDRNITEEKNNNNFFNQQTDFKMTRIEDDTDHGKEANLTMSMHSVREMVDGTSNSFATANEASLISESPPGGQFEYLIPASVYSREQLH